MYELWVETLATHIHDEVIGLFTHRAVWWSLQQVFDENLSLPPSLIFDYLAQTYSASMAVAVRRLTDTAENSNSLVRLLTKMTLHHQRLSRGRWLLRTSWDDKVFAARQFDDFAGSSDGTMPKDRVNRDRARLIESASKIKDFVDTTVAHMDSTRPASLPTFNELHDAVTTIGDVFGDWFGFLCGSALLSLVPTPQFDWSKCLTVPWIAARQRRPTLGEPPAGRSA